MRIVIREAMLELKLDLLLVKLTCVYPIPSTSRQEYCIVSEVKHKVELSPTI